MYVKWRFYCLNIIIFIRIYANQCKGFSDLLIFVHLRSIPRWLRLHAHDMGAQCMFWWGLKCCKSYALTIITTIYLIYTYRRFRTDMLDTTVHYHQKHSFSDGYPTQRSTTTFQDICRDVSNKGPFQQAGPHIKGSPQKSALSFTSLMRTNRVHLLKRGSPKSKALENLRAKIQQQRLVMISSSPQDHITRKVCRVRSKGL